MLPLEQVFEQQRRTAASDPPKGEAFRTFVLISALGERFVVPIERMREVVEASLVTPYPLAEAGFVGVANLRGTLLPVVELVLLDERLAIRAAGSTAREEKLLVVLETAKGELLGLLAQSVTKLSVAPEDQPKGDGGEFVISVNGAPARVVSLDVLKVNRGEVS